ncbi:hypothetical protein LJ737_26325 [Hymenobacter sp. 15J16-1T3B]|uniref:hypothetical protein n=1 Tax=Hymenobacter sp. 15J16-1T3B TaxID=2886941 RepID=UPI001D116F11|nr:hypothetical protein [Hymenobacter sp. 15J16-1T3B]MCC3160781.1 hypothetical protein [Hymenobacter sp. 15J16-1T3B]
MTPDPKDSESTPNESAEAQGRRENAQQTPDVASTGTDAAQPAATQGHMGDGSGQRGGYGDSDQTNGMEGGGQSATSADDSAQ